MEKKENSDNQQNEEEKKMPQRLMTEEEEKEYKRQIQEIREEIKNSGISDAAEYIERELAGLRLDAEQKDILKRCVEDESSAKELYKQFFSSLETKNQGNPRALKKIQNLAPLYDAHDFWDSQPVPKAYEKIEESMLDKPIDVDKTVEEIRQTPYNLPDGFYWADINMNNQEEVKEVYELLTQHYVEDDDNMFRFDYSTNFLQWALNMKDFKKDWIFGVRGGKKNRLYGFISGIPVHVSTRGKIVLMAEINFLCVHRSLRTKRLAPVLIKEVTRRVNLHNIWQAIYTAGIVIPKPISKTTYWHRSLNPKKLLDVGFSSLPQTQTKAQYVKLLKVPEKTTIPGLRPMQKKDVPAVHSLLTTYLQRCAVHIVFSEEEIAHFMLPRPDVIESFVVEDPDTKQVTDFISFYSLPSSVLKHVEHKLLRAAYSYYNVPGKHSLTDLMKDALVLAKQKNYDVFNALDIMENEQFLAELKFGIGDGHLHYYFYNWRIPDLEPKDIGCVLV